MVYKMNYTLNMKELINNLKGPKGLASLTEEYQKISSELKNITNSVKPQADEKIKELQDKFEQLKNKASDVQKDFEQEFVKTWNHFKKKALIAEKEIEIILKKKISTTKAGPSTRVMAKKTTKKRASVKALPKTVKARKKVAKI